MTDEQRLASHGYKLVTRAEFEAATDVPAGSTREVVRRVAAKWGGAFVVYDPNDDDNGWLLVGGDRSALARETVEHLSEIGPAAEPAQASLF